MISVRLQLLLFCFFLAEVAASPLAAIRRGQKGLLQAAKASNMRTEPVAAWPPRAAWNSLFARLTSSAAAAPCSAPVLGRARLKPDGLGSSLNNFANEILVAMLMGEPVALCAPAGVRDVWASHFRDPGFPRCSSCDYRAGHHPDDAWIRGFEVGRAVLRSGSDDRALLVDLKRFLYRHLFRFTDSAQTIVNSRARALGLAGHRFVGVHIRRGDRYRPETAIPIERFADAVRRRCIQANTTTVFLATDASKEQATLQKALGPNFRVLEQTRLSDDHYAVRGDSARLQPPLPKVVEAEAALLTDVSLLVRADAFIGTASSNVGRLVFFLRDQALPAESLDDGGDFLHEPGL